MGGVGGHARRAVLRALAERNFAVQFAGISQIAEVRRRHQPKSKSAKIVTIFTTVCASFEISDSDDNLEKTYQLMTKDLLTFATVVGEVQRMLT